MSGIGTMHRMNLLYQSNAALRAVPENGAICRRAIPALALLASSLWFAAAARGDDERVKYEISQISSSVGGVLIYVPDQWGLLHLNLTNPLDRETEILCATAFENETTLQYGRRIWLPPRSRLKTWHLVRLPPTRRLEPPRLSYRTSVMDAAGEHESLIRDDSGKMQLTSFLQFSTPGEVTGMIGAAADDEAGDRRRSETHQVIAAARSRGGEMPRITELADPVVPLLSESLAAVEDLVIADGSLQHDATALSSIRRWLYRGGRLWVLLEQVDPRFMEMLLGDEWNCQIVDRVGLTSVSLKSAASHIPKTELHADFEEPVDFVRTIVSDAEVRYTVDGWPAAFWKKCGSGSLLVTTLGPRAWWREPSQIERSRFNPNMPQVSFLASEPLSHVTHEMFTPKRGEALPAAALEPQMRDYVGYSIPSRGLVVGLLGLFGMLLAGGGLCLWRMGRLEWFGAAGPLLAAFFSVVLLGIGRQHRDAVPSTVAQVQIVEPIPGTDDVLVRGTAGVFTNDSATAVLEGAGGGWLIPDMEGLAGTTRRLVWTDLDRWRWENLSQGAGLRSAAFVASKQLPVRSTAVATFGPRGVSGSLSLPSGFTAADAVLATRTGRVGVSLGADGRFTAQADQTFSEEQYLSAGLLSDEQHRRSQTLQGLLKRESQFDHPMLLCWTAPWDLGMDFGAASNRAGSALVALPLQLERPPDGTEFLIPSPLLPYRGALGPDGLAPTGLYDHRSGEWIEKTGTTSSWIRFQIPRVVLPVEPVAARLRVKVAGPVGKLQIAGWKDDRVVPINTWIDPVGTLSIEITDRQVLQPIDAGGLFLLVTGGDPDRPELTKITSEQGERVLYWQIESLTMELQARIPPAANGAADNPAKTSQN
jgi:hypothetical protein